MADIRIDGTGRAFMASPRTIRALAVTVYYTDDHLVSIEIPWDAIQVDGDADNVQFDTLFSDE